ncbi:FAD/NAD(P)-binding protein [Streptomyces sp. NPDC056479]|uniref:FAD/NAD(P)-binding protein n=1 Tax=Streptomyces sp. NPDC056479 TaxID=3345832 RepID=UPI0036AE22FF
MDGSRLDLCIIGMGPRGLAVLERICANAEAAVPESRVVVHVVDPHPPGPGKVWRPAQSRHLLMNTVASQVTMFPDESVDLHGPLRPGPSLHEWARFLVLIGSFGGRHYPEETLAEAAGLDPDSYATRAFYGHYLEWVYDRVVGTSADRVTVVVHRSQAVRLDEEREEEREHTETAGGAGDAARGDRGPAQSVLLADGTRLAGLRGIVLTQGHLPTVASPREAEFRAFARAERLHYVAPGNPADADLSSVLPGEPVALMGLGLNFFDHMALLTLGRGGTFERDGDGRLRYWPSGREPVLHAGSRRGVPFHSRGANQKGPYGRHEPVVLDRATVGKLRALAARRGGLDFRRDIWPLLAREVETVYYGALLTAQGRARDAGELRARYPVLPREDGAERGLLDAYGIPAELRWDWELVARPYGDRTFTGPADYRDWITGHLRADIAAAREGNVDGPVKAAVDVLRDLRNEIRLLVDHSGLTGDSHRQDLDRWYTPLNAFLSIGPPVRRTEEALALIEAGILHMTGPGTRARPDPQAHAFAVDSGRVPGSEVWTSVLIDARMPDVDLRRTADPLLRQMAVARQVRPHRIPDPGGDAYETGGLAVTARPYHPVDGSGRPHPRRFVFGVPTESVHWVTAAGIRPGVNSVILSDADAIARAALDLTDVCPPPGSDSTPTTKAAV